MLSCVTIKPRRKLVCKALSPCDCNRSVFLQTKDMPTKGKIMFWHKSFGLLMGGAIVARIGAAIITRRPAAVPGPVYEQLAGKLTHAALCKISGWCGGTLPRRFIPLTLLVMSGQQMDS